MKVLVATTPGAGHVNPVAPFARALVELGHTVTWATAASACDGVARLGFDVRPAGLGLEVRNPRLLELHPEVLTVAPAERRPIMFRGLFAELAAPAMAADLAPMLDELRPDLVVHEVAELVAPALAAARGLPVVTVAFSGALPAVVRNALRDAVTPVWADVGLDVPDDLGMGTHAYLHPFPPSFGQRPALASVRDVRPVSDDRAASSAPPAWLDELGRERPLVYVTFGTEMSPVAPWPTILAGVADAGVDALVTVGAQLDPAPMLAHVPAGATGQVRIERYVPQSFVLARANAVVSHTGAGTVLAAAAAGLPQLALPMGADQFDNAAALTASGVGRALDLASLTADGLAAALRAILDDPAVTRAASSVAAEIAAMPPPDRLAAELVPSSTRS